MRSLKTVQDQFNATFKPTLQSGEWIQGYRDAEQGIEHKSQTGDYERGYSAQKNRDANMEALG